MNISSSFLDESLFCIYLLKIFQSFLWYIRWWKFIIFFEVLFSIVSSPTWRVVKSCSSISDIFFLFLFHQPSSEYTKLLQQICIFWNDFNIESLIRKVFLSSSDIFSHGKSSPANLSTLQKRTLNSSDLFFSSKVFIKSNAAGLDRFGSSRKRPYPIQYIF